MYAGSRADSRLERQHLDVWWYANWQHKHAFWASPPAAVSAVVDDVATVAKTATPFMLQYAVEMERARAVRLRETRESVFGLGSPRNAGDHQRPPGVIDSTCTPSTFGMQ